MRKMCERKSRSRDNLYFSATYLINILISPFLLMITFKQISPYFRQIVNYFEQKVCEKSIEPFSCLLYIMDGCCFTRTSIVEGIRNFRLLFYFCYISVSLY
jgi:hypothetical protein